LALTIVDDSSTPAKGVAEIVEKRNKHTLLPIINMVVMAGSVIHTDDWAAYNDISNNENFSHLKITYKFHFLILCLEFTTICCFIQHKFK
jgi:hypothetical protein